MKEKSLKPFILLKVAINRLKLLYFFLFFPRLTYTLFYLFRPFYEPKENFLNRTFRYGILTFGGGLTPFKEMKAMQAGAKALFENMEEAIKAKKMNKPVAWVEWILNAEILEAFDIVSFNPELLNLFGNAKGIEYPPLVIAEAEKKGVPVETCSAVKCTVGSILLEQIPHPDIIIGASHPCDSSISIYQQLEYLTGSPTFSFDSPYWKDDASYKYFEKNTWDLIDFLEKNLNQRMDWDKLKEVLERTNKVNFYLQEICEMNRAIPCPGTMISLLYAWVIKEVCVRSPLAVPMAKGLYEVTKSRFDKGEGVVKKEKIRVLKWFPPIGFFTYLFKWMEHKFGAVVVADFIGHVSTIQMDTSSKKSMIRDLAKAQMHIAMARQCHGPVEFLTDELGKLIDDYSPDCVMFMGHNGCKHGWAALKIIQDFLKRKKMPTLYLNLDIMDKRHTNEEGIKKQITEFFVSHGWA